MNDIEVFKPLYPPEGAPVCGYLCLARKGISQCREVTRTKRGMWTHLRIVHKIKKQAEFVFEKPAEDRVAADSSL